ncbi:MAG: thioredoxin-dependent peroxiredoxin [Acidobacteriota bacterium]|jgi:peroxiredoxin Q/BCP|nr:thioredoxin-dependent peroxiredoxin [Acidobacteriota bacterium]
MKLLSIVALTLLFAATTPAADVASAVPAEGTAAPAFSLLSQDGKAVSLNDLHGKWVVLYFYPKDFTSGCTLEAHNFQRDLAKYEADNAVILGVSLDPVDSHKGFCTKEGLNFKLLADTDHVVASKYGSLMVHDGTNYAARNTFLIDPKGVIRKVYLKVAPAKHSDDVLADLAALKAAK